MPAKRGVAFSLVKKLLAFNDTLNDKAYFLFLISYFSFLISYFLFLIS